KAVFPLSTSQSGKVTDAVIIPQLGKARSIFHDSSSQPGRKSMSESAKQIHSLGIPARIIFNAPVLPRLCSESTNQSIQPVSCSLVSSHFTSGQLPLSNTR